MLAQETHMRAPMTTASPLLDRTGADFLNAHGGG
jgi:hypothetical protein